MESIYTSRQTSSFIYISWGKEYKQNKQTEKLPDNDNRKHSHTPEKTPWPKTKETKIPEKKKT